MSGADDDDSTVIIIQRAKEKAKALVSAPVTLKRWHLAALIALTALVSALVL